MSNFLYGVHRVFQDKNKCSKISHVTIPFSNISTCTMHDWFVSTSTVVPTKNGKSLTPILNFGEIGMGVERQQALQFLTQTLVKVRSIVCLSLLTHLCPQKM